MTEKYIQSLQEKDAQIKRIGWLGPRGTFTEKAAKKWQIKVGELEAYLAKDYSPSIAAIFKDVLNGSLDIGVVPIENTIGGPVKDTHAAFEELDGFSIVGEIVLPIHQYCYYQNREGVTTIASKDQAIFQSSRWIGENYPTAKRQPVDSTSLAVQMAVLDPSIAAIAGADTALELGLADKLIRTGDSIEDDKNNATTFVVITKAKELPEPTGNDKTTLMLELCNEAGSLSSILEYLSQRGINLTKIKSLRSADGGIRFLISIDGHQKEEKIVPALEALKEKALRIKTFGSYPKDNYVPKQRSEPNIANAIAMIKKEAQNGDAKIPDNSTLVFTLPNEVGALAKVLKIFAKKNINLTKIDSMPSGNFEEYIFYLSFDKNGVKDHNNVLKELVCHCNNVVQLQ